MIKSVAIVSHKHDKTPGKVLIIILLTHFMFMFLFDTWVVRNGVC